jgi:hypothetical protein
VLRIRDALFRIRIRVFSILDPDPNIFSSRIQHKREMKSKTNFFLVIYGLQVHILVVSIDAWTIEKKIMKKLKNYHIKNVPDPGPEIRKRILDPGGVKTTGSRTRIRNTGLHTT